MDERTCLLESNQHEDIITQEENIFDKYEIKNIE